MVVLERGMATAGGVVDERVGVDEALVLAVVTSVPTISTTAGVVEDIESAVDWVARSESDVVRASSIVVEATSSVAGATPEVPPASSAKIASGLNAREKSWNRASTANERRFWFSMNENTDL
jgi:hypothetical protein